MTRKKEILEKINSSIVDEEDIERITKLLKTGFLSKPDGGPFVEEFQKMMGKAHNMKYAYAVNSGTSALHCAISALELEPGSEVIVPALANIADCSTVIQEGGVPVFADIDDHTFNLDPKNVEERITDKTKAIIAVHIYGEPVDVDEISRIAKKHNLALIEDCAQAAGAKYKGKYVGSFGDISCFSLYQTKHIICGEGGIVATDNEKYAKIITSVANNGIVKDRLDDYDYDRIGYNYQLSEMQAALAIGQMKKLDQNNKERRKNVEIYKKILSDTGIEFQQTSDHTENSYFYLTALLPESLKEKRDDFLKIVGESDAPVKKLYPMALTEVTLFKDRVSQNCPVAREITKRVFNLYVNPGLEQSDIEYMAEAVKKAYAQIQ